MGNRVEELEQQVAELRATVDGLTEELVETKERLNQLEASDDADGETDDRRSQAHVEFVPNQAPEEHTEYVGKDGVVRTADRAETAQSEAPSDGGERGDPERETDSQETPPEAATGETDPDETASRDTGGDDGDGDDIIVA